MFLHGSLTNNVKFDRFTNSIHNIIGFVSYTVIL